MRHPRLIYGLGLATAVALLVLLAARHLCAQGEIAAELAVLRDLGHPTSLAELVARHPAVPAAENAGLALEAVTDQITDTGTPDAATLLDGGRAGTVPWTEAELAAAETIVATNKAAFASLHEVLQRPRIRLVRNLSAGVSMHLPRIFGFITAARTLAMSARWEAHQGRPAAAAGRLGDALELSRLLAEEPTVLVTAIGSLATANVALNGLETALNRTGFPDSDLRRLQAALDRGWTTNLVERALVSEFCGMRDLAGMPAPTFFRVVGSFGAPGSGPSGLEELYFRFFVASGMRHADFGFYTRRTLLYLEILRGDPRQREQRLTTAQAETQRWIQDHHLWTRFSALVMPRYLSVSEQDSQNRVRNRAAHAVLAIERYRLEHDDELPPTLDVLVPEFLDGVPQDLYAAAPLRFRKLDHGYVVYSVGRDLKDDGGDATNEADIAFRVGR